MLNLRLSFESLNWKSIIYFQFKDSKLEYNLKIIFSYLYFKNFENWLTHILFIDISTSFLLHYYFVIFIILFWQ